MNEEIVNTLETIYRKKMNVVVKWQDSKIVEVVGLEALVACYVSYILPRSVGSMADKEDAPKSVVLDWTIEGKDEIPVYHSGTRKGAPTTADREKAEAYWALPDEILEGKLESARKLVEHELTLELLNAEESDPEEMLAVLARQVRLAAEAAAKKAEKEAF